MKVLQARPHTNPQKARKHYVQVYVDNRWKANREFYVGRCSYKCDARGIDQLEFVQLEALEDCALVEQAGAFWVHIAVGDVFRRCRTCGSYMNTMYGYRRRGSSIPLATGNHRWAPAR